MSNAIARSVTTASVAPPDLRGTRLLEFCDYYGPASMGGSERVARQVNRRLVQLGADLTVTSALVGEPFDDDGVRVLARPATDLSGLVGAQLAVSRGYMRAALNAARLFRPHVLYAHSLHFHGSLVAARLSRILHLPLVTVVHVGGLSELGGIARGGAEVFERTIGRFVLGSSREVVAVSESVAEHSRHRGARPESVSVAENGVDHERFAPTPPARDEDGVPTVVFIGRLVGNKGPRLAVEAVRRLRRRGTRVRLLVVGDGPSRAALEASARGIDGGCTFVGRVADVVPWIRRADVVVRPSFTEGRPLAVLEAMASRRCVVVSDIPAHREVVEHLVNGLVHRPGDVDDLVTQLTLVLDDADRRERLADQACHSIRRYTWEATARAHAHAIARAAAAVPCVRLGAGGSA